MEKSVIIACGDPRDFFFDTIAWPLRQEAMRVDITADIAFARARANAGTVKLVIVDSTFPQEESLLAHLGDHSDTSQIPVLQLLPEGGRKKWARRLKRIGDAQLAQPYEIIDVTTAAKALLARKPREAPGLVSARMVFPTEDRWIDDASETVAKLLGQSWLDGNGQIQMCAAFREAIANAAHYGNGYSAEKFIEASASADDERIEFTVTDEGNGFDWRPYMVPSLKPEELRRKLLAAGKSGGLGIATMRRHSTSVVYNEQGTSVTVTRQRREEAERSLRDLS